MSPRSKVAPRTATPRTSSETTDRTGSILDAATAVFLKSGYSRASTREIARLAGASKETLYQRFPTKASLFAALIERKSKDLFASLSNDVEGGTQDPYQTLSRFGVHLLALMAAPETQRLHRVVISEAAEFPELALTFWDRGPGRARKMLEMYFEELAKRKLLPKGEASFAAEVFLSSLAGGLLLRLPLGVSSFLMDEASQAAWVHKIVQTFLSTHVQRQVDLRPKATVSKSTNTKRIRQSDKEGLPR